MSEATGTVTVRVYGALRHAVGGREVHLACEGATVKETLPRP